MDMPTPRRGRVFSIAPQSPFLRELAAALVDGRLVEGFRPLDDPLALPSATIYLPTRRSARAFGIEIVAALGGRAALLPQIRTLGDGDEEELALAAAEGPDLPPEAGRLERQFDLAAMVRAWTTTLSQQTRSLYGDEDIVIPSSATEAYRLAGDLTRLLDQLDTEEVGLDLLAGLGGQDHAQWWDLTFTFLKIVAQYWPQRLAETGRIDPSARRRAILDRRAGMVRDGRLPGPVIAAGSTGSIPAVARLLAAIAAAPNGAVVLPGVDFDLAEAVWQRLGEPAPAGGHDSGSEAAALQAQTHPQYGLATLLRRIGIDRRDIGRLGVAPPALAPRARAVSLALLPAAETGRWRDAAPTAEAARDVAIIEAPGEREEALAIALALRETLAAPGRTAALVTPDRALARRVAAELARFGIDIDDSAGEPLQATPAGRFALALVCAATRPGDAVALAAFLKNPAIAGDGHAARLFELAVLRDAILVPAPGGFEAAVAGARARAGRSRYAPAALRAMTGADWDAAAALAAHADRALAPLVALAGQGAVPPAAAFAAFRQALALALGDGERLLALRGGRELASLLDGFDALGDDVGPAIAAGELPDLFLAVCSETVVRSARVAHGRLHVWGPLEARLQHVDRLVLGSLNEGSWPAAARNDAFLNRPMKAGIGLSFPERRIGLSAHDFQQFCGAGELVLARALKADNAPTVASRWLQRLLAVAGDTAGKAMRAAGRRYLSLAAALDRPDAPPRRIRRPQPRPPLALRPTTLSITEIETWIRDPYAIYARHVLGLSPLGELGRQADPALRGSLYHDVLARFIRDRPPGEASGTALLRLENIAGKVFGEEAVAPEVAAFWLPRLSAVGRLLIEWEAERDDAVAARACEVSGRQTLPPSGFVIRGRADRIDRLVAGGIEVIDYKTGTSPSARQARVLSPQLALEAKMAELGAFGPDHAGSPTALSYVRLRPGDELKVDAVATGKPGETATELADAAWAKLAGLVAAYQRPEQGYLSRYAVMREGDAGGDYDHLARYLEWSVGEDEDE